MLSVNGDNPRVTQTMVEMFQVFQKMFSKAFMENLVVVFTHWNMSEKRRKRRFVTSGKSDSDRIEDFLQHLGLFCKISKPSKYVIIDAFYDEDDETEIEIYKSSMIWLYQTLQESPRIYTSDFVTTETQLMETKKELKKSKKQMDEVRQNLTRVKVENRKREAEMDSRLRQQERARAEMQRKMEFDHFCVILRDIFADISHHIQVEQMKARRTQIEREQRQRANRQRLDFDREIENLRQQLSRDSDSDSGICSIM